MEIGTALDVMTGGLTAADASARQVSGILAWGDLAAASREAALAVTSTPAGLTVTAGESRVHRQWRDQALAITAAFRAQAAHADRIAAAATAAAERAEAAAADAALARNAALAASAAAVAAANRERAAAAMRWQAAALDAATAGDSLITREDTITVPVGDAQAAAGGVPEAAASKHYYTLEPA